MKQTLSFDQERVTGRSQFIMNDRCQAAPTTFTFRRQNTCLISVVRNKLAARNELQYIATRSSRTLSDAPIQWVKLWRKQTGDNRNWTISHKGCLLRESIEARSCHQGHNQWEQQEHACPSFVPKLFLNQKCNFLSPTVLHSASRFWLLDWWNNRFKQNRRRHFTVLLFFAQN